MILIFNITEILSIADTKNWNKFGSSWVIENSKAYTDNSFGPAWGYYELTNYNSIVSINPFNNFSSFEVKAVAFDKGKTPAEILLSFNITSESQAWYYHMYAFKLTGGYWGINRAALIHSDRADKSKPFNTKNNTFINELASASCKVKYGVPYNYRVAFIGSDVVLFINGEKILSAPFPSKNREGRIAVSSRNVKIAIDKVEIAQGEKTEFIDDFIENSILINKAAVDRVPSNGQKKENPKQK